MTIAQGFVDDVYFVRWIDAEAADAETIVAEVQRERSRREGPLHYIAIIGEHLPPPPDDVRAAMRENVEALLEFCDTVHLVIEGRGFRRAMARSIGTSIFLLSRHRGRTFAHDTVPHALERVGYDAPHIATVMKRANEAGLLSAAT